MCHTGTGAGGAGMRSGAGALRAWTVAMLLLAGGAALGGCGDGQSVSDKVIARDAVLTLSDLPAGALEADRPFVKRTCLPVSDFRDGSAAVAISPGFAVRATKVEQVVGVFPAVADARRAFRAITSDERRDCTIAALQLESRRRVGQNAAISTSRRQFLVDGSTARSVRYTVDLRVFNIKGDLQTVAINVGRGVTSWAFISQSTPLARNVIQNIVRKATKALADGMAESK